MSFQDDQIFAGNTPCPGQTEHTLTSIETDALGEIGNICMGASATTLYMLLNRRVSITAPHVSVCESADQLENYKLPCVAVSVSYIEGIIGYNVFLLKQSDALLITDLLMGGDGSNPSYEQYAEIYLSAICEVMNQMVGASSTSLSHLLSIPVNISPPVVNEILLDGDSLGNLIPDGSVFIKISFLMEIEGLLSSRIMQILPFAMGKTLAKDLIGEQASEDTQSDAPVVAMPVETPKIEAAKTGSSVINVPKTVPVPAAFSREAQAVPQPPQPYTGGMRSIDLLGDVQLRLSVELGRTRMSIKDVLAMKLGSVIVLDHFANDAVDLVVSGKRFARGDVVSVDDSYGVRIREIVRPV